MTKLRAGFTLIELMVALAIAAILALMAIPSFQDQVIRGQITEALPLTDVAKQPIAAWWAARASFPRDNAAIGLPAAEKVVNNHISSVSVENGTIHVTFGHRAHAQISGKVLSIRPAVVEDAPVVPVAWVCGYAEGPPPMNVRGENKTNVQPSFLPFTCRARTK